jgi:hypothetical protein
LLNFLSCWATFLRMTIGLNIDVDTILDGSRY